MTKYHDEFCARYGATIGSLSGCGLDLTGRMVTYSEKEAALNFYTAYEVQLKQASIGEGQRDVRDFIETGIIPQWLQRR